MAAGLVPAIHAFIQRRKQEADARDKPGMTEETGALGCGLISTQPNADRCELDESQIVGPDAFNRQNRTTGVSEITPKPDMTRTAQFS